MKTYNWLEWVYRGHIVRDLSINLLPFAQGSDLLERTREKNIYIYLEMCVLVRILFAHSLFRLFVRCLINKKPFKLIEMCYTINVRVWAHCCWVIKGLYFWIDFPITYLILVAVWFSAYVLLKRLVIFFSTQQKKIIYYTKSISSRKTFFFWEMLIWQAGHFFFA